MYRMTVFVFKMRKEIIIDLTSTIVTDLQTFAIILPFDTFNEMDQANDDIKKYRSQFIIGARAGVASIPDLLLMPTIEYLMSLSVNTRLDIFDI